MRRRDSSLSSIFNDLRADFRAGKDTRFTSRLSGVSSSGSGADYHYRNEQQYLHMMERARHYQRNDPVVGQGVRRLVANIIQDGFKLDPQTGDDALDLLLWERWKAWSEDADQCHSEGELVFHEMESLALSSVVVDGDIFALPLKEGSLQWIEAHRVRTPSNTTKNVVNGVMLNQAAKRLEYWITKEDLDPRRALSRVSDIKAYSARDPDGNRLVRHLYMPFRFSQRRGVTALAPVSDTVGMHDDIQFATLVKAQMAALIAILHERGADWEPLGDQQKGEREVETAAGYSRTIEGVSAGLEIFSDKDETLKMESAAIPSPEFFPHAMMILSFIAINLDMPVAMLLLDPSNTNFSGWRGAVDQARMRFKQIQMWMSLKFHSPIYRWKVMQWLATDAALANAAKKAGVNIFNHRFNLPTFPYIEPLQDASADLLQVRNALNSPRRIQANRGRDWEEVADETIADNGYAIRKAKREAADINKEFNDGAPVQWRELISLPTPDGIQISLNSQQQQTAPPKNQNGTNGKENNRVFDPCLTSKN